MATVLTQSTRNNVSTPCPECGGNQFVPTADSKVIDCPVCGPKPTAKYRSLADAMANAPELFYGDDDENGGDVW